MVKESGAFAGENLVLCWRGGPKKSKLKKKMIGRTQRVSFEMRQSVKQPSERKKGPPGKKKKQGIKEKDKNWGIRREANNGGKATATG